MANNKLSLGIELGSTRIKTVLIDDKFNTLASGTFDWENKLKNGYWTYDLDDVWVGIQEAIKDLKSDDLLNSIESIGVSAMMHGYLAFDSKENLLVPFRTWRNSNTDQATKILSKALNFNIPHRWSIAHLFQAILDDEEHVSDLDYLTTLAGYVHWKLTDKKVLGIGDASGMFPIDSQNSNYDEEKVKACNRLLKEEGFNKNIETLLPKALTAGSYAGTLSDKGAKLLDPSGKIVSGLLMSPPEGDAGTGMVATNSIKKKTGNVSAGTSVFAMIVLEKELENVYPEIDIVTTPEGQSVAMVHVNNCTSDLNSWVSLFKELLNNFGVEASDDDLYGKLIKSALNADEDDGGLLSFGYLSGENITKVVEGRPMFLRLPDANFNLSNFMSSHLNAAFAALNIGINILYDEGVSVEEIKAHGGIFKTELVAQKILASALKAPISISKTASEGGAWGMAILANYSLDQKGKSLVEFLDDCVFSEEKLTTHTPSNEDVESYNLFMDKHIKALEIQKSAGKNFQR